VPSTWGGSYKAIQVIGGAVASNGTASISLAQNATWNGANWLYTNTAAASQFETWGGAFYWQIAASGTAGNTVSFTQAMTLTASGNLGLGNTSPGAWRALISQAGNQTLQLNNSTGTGNRLYFTDTTWGAEIGHVAGNLSFRTGGTTERMTVDYNGNVVVNSAAVATTATDGFLYIPTCAGTPTGTPTTYSGRAPLVVDSTNSKLYMYVGGAWVALN
jgi:hypothetical protein